VKTKSRFTSRGRKLAAERLSSQSWNSPELSEVVAVVDGSKAKQNTDTKEHKPRARVRWATPISTSSDETGTPDDVVSLSHSGDDANSGSSGQDGAGAKQALNVCKVPETEAYQDTPSDTTSEADIAYMQELEQRAQLFLASQLQTWTDHNYFGYTPDQVPYNACSSNSMPRGQVPQVPHNMMNTSQVRGTAQVLPPMQANFSGFCQYMYPYAMPYGAHY
jgi:hypothetical protein